MKRATISPPVAYVAGYIGYGADDKSSITDEEQRSNVTGNPPIVHATVDHGEQHEDRTLRRNVVSSSCGYLRSTWTKYYWILGPLIFAFIGLVLMVIIYAVGKRERKQTGGAVFVPPTAHPTSIKTASPSSSPPDRTMTPNSSNEDEREETLNAALGGILDKESLNDEASAQFRAWHWMLREDSLVLNLSDEELVDRFVLVLLYYATDGQNWNEKQDFLWEDSHHCSWHSSVVCWKFRLTEIRLPANGLNGRLPSELRHMVHLEILNLNQNGITGSVPSELGELVMLSELHLFENWLSGGFPSTLFGLSNLRHLDLESNSLTGSIPANLGSCFRLTHLNINSNLLSGEIPTSVNNLTLLEYLSLSKNVALDGSIPSFATRNRLHWLYLGKNSFSGTIPAELFQIQTLKVVDFSENDLTGTIPIEAGQIHGLESLWLYNNLLWGTIPSFYGLTELEELDLEENLLTGTLDNVLAYETSSTLTNLKVLYLGNNRLYSTIPEGVGMLTELNILSIHNANLKGTIPSSIGQLTKLDKIKLHSNALEGQVPSELGFLTSLETLDICCNELSGSLFVEEFSHLTSLEYLHISSNYFTGPIPWSGDDLPRLKSFQLEDNFLVGNLTESFCVTPTLQEERSLIADCAGPDPLVECSCCILCCDRDGGCYKLVR